MLLRLENILGKLSQDSVSRKNEFEVSLNDIRNEDGKVPVEATGISEDLRGQTMPDNQPNEKSAVVCTTCVGSYK